MQFAANAARSREIAHHQPAGGAQSRGDRTVYVRNPADKKRLRVRVHVEVRRHHQGQTLCPDQADQSSDLHRSQAVGKSPGDHRQIGPPGSSQDTRFTGRSGDLPIGQVFILQQAQVPQFQTFPRRSIRRSPRRLPEAMIEIPPKFKDMPPIRPAAAGVSRRRLHAATRQ